MSRARGRQAAAAPPRTVPAEVATLISDGALPPAGVRVRVRFPRSARYMEGLVDGYVHIDGALHVRIARSERHDDGQVRAIRRSIAWSSVESCSWDVTPTPRDVVHAIPVHTAPEPPPAPEAPGCERCGQQEDLDPEDGLCGVCSASNAMRVAL